MSFGTSLLSKLRPGVDRMSPLLPLHTSPPSSSQADDVDLSELSPRPDQALLSPDNTHDSPYKHGSPGSPNNTSSPSGSMDRASVRTKGKGKAISFAYQDIPSTQSRAIHPIIDYTATRKTPRTNQTNSNGPETWRLPFSPERRENARPQMSFMESVFSRRPSGSSDRTPRSEIDDTFKMIQRRERQMQKELQKLLDAQSEALERDLDGGDAGKDTSLDSKRAISPDSSSTSTSNSNMPNGSVIPVRQPKRKLLSKRQARIGISRSVTMLSDLKNEEDAYIATALARRKSALSRLRSLSSQHKSIVAEMKAIEEDGDSPAKTEMTRMEDQYHTVCSDIEKLEQRLRRLKRTKVDLERKLEEARSTRESSLSGYKGALRQCDQGIRELMKYPGIEVLEVEDLMGPGEDIGALMSKHMSGFEFLSLRPERRTMEMAKDWWEGEVAILEKRKAAVDRERIALEEGSQIWQQALTLLVDFEGQLNRSLSAAMANTSTRPSPGSKTPESILRDQYKALKAALREIQNLHDHVEAQGWNLLVVAIGAELAHFIGLKDYLAAVIRDAGYDDGLISPLRAPNANLSTDGDLVDVRGNGAGEEHRGGGHEKEEELTTSVVRHWEEAAVNEQSNNGPSNLLDADRREESDDNEVPPGLLSETHHESEDDHPNEVPPEFLSMHSPQREKKHEEKHHDLSRQSSSNEVPPDLLAEGDDALD
ncbi:hypothetical protein F4779DRAFT_112859 [Xylariaceae sp. FL0662B]|nr:hypothetical protein F4779DRAFT_112859 [Xylariaceae sp. FL0662B]